MLRLGFLFILFLSSNLYAQFINRYPKVQGLRHHTYLEGYDFPFYSNGPVSPVASPDGKSIAFSAYGWMWVYDRSNQKATRITKGGDMDFLPSWSADGKKIAFVRDTRKETLIMSYDLESNKEILVVDHANASELDPYFSKDGNYLYYTSSAAGTFDIWRINLTTQNREKLTTAENGMEMRPVPVGVNGNFYFISKTGGVDRINFFNSSTSETSIIHEGRILSQLWFDASLSGKQLVFNWPTQATWELFTASAEKSAARLLLYSQENYVTYPSWNQANSTVLFSLAGDDHVFSMYEISSSGGSAAKLVIDSWEWSAPIKPVRFEIIQDDKLSPARVVAIDDIGHYLIPQGAIARFDSQQGEIYFYTEGEFTLQVPGEKITIKASRGLLDRQENLLSLTSINSIVPIRLPHLWNKPDWYAGEHHFHLNYGGPFKLQPQDLVPILKAEALDFATPMAANLHFLLKDQEMMKWEKTDFPKIRFGQEVRSHFHGHIGLFGSTALFWPWFWGPTSYEINTFDDRMNDEVLAFARKTGGVGTYVHPISEQRPLLNDESMARIPVGLVSDVVNGNLDAFEMACLWSDEIGSSVVYHQFLNLGIPTALSAGTDAFPGFARCMAVGTARIYVNTEKTDWESYLTALKQGHSFVTTGPMIDLKIDGKIPGQAVAVKKLVPWELELATANEVDHIELICNGEVIWKSNEIVKGYSKFAGVAKIPKGGWLAARVFGSTSQWPLMDSYPFAHTNPIWIGAVGSVDPLVRKKSAQTLLKVLQLSWAKINTAYAGNQIPRQAAEFQKAKEKLEAWTK